MAGLSPVDREGLTHKIVDRLLTLYLYDRVSQQSKMYGDVKLQKLVFLSEKRMLENLERGYHYRFFRWEHGPMSRGVYEDHDFLQSNGLVSEESRQISERGREVLREAQDLLDQNSEFVAPIESVVDEYGSESGRQLKQLVYDMEVSPLTLDRSLRVGDIPEGVDIYFPLPDHLASNTFDIDDGWIETLSVMFDTESKDRLDRAIQDARESNDSVPLELEHVERT